MDCIVWRSEKEERSYVFDEPGTETMHEGASAAEDGDARRAARQRRRETDRKSVV